MQTQDPLGWADDVPSYSAYLAGKRWVRRTRRITPRKVDETTLHTTVTTARLIVRSV